MGKWVSQNKNKLVVFWNTRLSLWAKCRSWKSEKLSTSPDVVAFSVQGLKISSYVGHNMPLIANLPAQCHSQIAMQVSRWSSLLTKSVTPSIKVCGYLPGDKNSGAFNVWFSVTECFCLWSYQSMMAVAGPSVSQCRLSSNHLSCSR